MWQKFVPIEGSAAFKVPRFMRAYDTSVGEEQRYMTAKLLNHQPDQASVYTTMGNRFKRINQSWKIRRPWYADEYKKWQMTPWAWPQCRTLISRLKEAQLDSVVHLGSCAQVEAKQISERLSRYMKIYFANKKAKAGENSVIWLFAVIGLLMEASIPYMDDEYNEMTVTTEFHPSTQAAAKNGWPTLISNRKSKRSGCAKSKYSNHGEMLDKFKDLFAQCVKTYAMPQSWISALAQAARDVIAERQKNPEPDVHTSFNFDIPPYDSSEPWVVRQDNESADVFLRDAERLISVAAAPTSTKGRMVSVSSAATKSVAMKNSISSQSRLTRIPTLYFTVGEITNHRAVDHAWIVEPDGSYGYDVYDITEELKQLKLTNQQYQALLAMTPDRCRMLSRNGAQANAIRAKLGKEISRIGKQMMELHPAEFEEYTDGQGRSSGKTWVAFGTYIYDITEFPFTSQDEKQRVLQASRDEMPDPSSPADQFDDELLDNLSLFKCGSLKSSKSSVRPQLYPMTEKMLRWHDNPGTGVYVAIQDVIYDITGYIEHHPGGRDILMMGGGVDQTAAFLQSHDPAILRDYEELKVGRLVKEVNLDEVKRDEIVLHDWVFNINGLRGKDPVLYNDLLSHRGTDATSVLTTEGSASVALSRLYLHEKASVVAKLRDLRPLPTITDGVLARHYEPDWAGGAWLEANGDVYNVTDIMEHPQYYRKEIPQVWAGKNLTRPDLLIWLTTTHAERRIGRLVTGPAANPKERVQSRSAGAAQSWKAWAEAAAEDPALLPDDNDRRCCTRYREGDNITDYFEIEVDPDTIGSGEGWEPDAKRRKVEIW
ncbi:Uu.00g073620.m01.CDS01 [Anthostomella pinea]|uniref:Uu.00g073620.m01.CDS01 n=1 Tax=Anthostomella pinea TaxID=933095 RepID=A0AAI8VVA9_9PEZI|nr:Uu.00g073620.m01.CDS01 [Anthostomella pinea]